MAGMWSRLMNGVVKKICKFVQSGVGIELKRNTLMKKMIKSLLNSTLCVTFAVRI